MEVMERYRELGSTLEASIQVRREAEEAADKHWHRLGERCWCGHLALPGWCYVSGWDEKKKTSALISHEKAEERYLRWLASSEKPEYVNPPVMEEIRGVQRRPVETSKKSVRQEKALSPAAAEEEGAGVTQEVLKTCNACNKPLHNRGKVCNACRQAAYRERGTK